MRTTMTRRGFLALAGGAALAGCTASAEEVAPNGQATTGGALRALFPGAGAAESLDPHVPPTPLDRARHKALFDKLVELDDDLRPVPRLAKRWESDADATVWRFTLREARFHDGRVLTPDDVLATLARVTDPNAQGRVARSALAALDLANSRAADATTVELALTAPTAELPALLAGAGTAIVPADYADPAKAVGTGPFALAAFEPGRLLVARAFADHWDGAPHLAELHVLTAGDEAARVAALRAGGAEYAHGLGPAFVDAAGSSLRALTARGGVAHGFAMRADRAPFDDPRVRAAFRLLADRTALVGQVLGGRGEVGNDLFGKGFQHYAGDLPQRLRDVAAARELLRGAGAGDLAVTLRTTELPVVREAAELYAGQLREGGVAVTVEVRPEATYAAERAAGDGLWSYWAEPTTIPGHLESAEERAVTGWRDPEHDLALEQARSTVDSATRGELYRRVQRVRHDQGALLVWGHADAVAGTTAAVRGVAAARQDTDGWARFDRAWLSA
ncbi:MULTISPECIES: ABC transporter substrate-binding protein [Actinosynnema]|uniref:ABC transporter substrate-binding protein n=1 Tax=Actinosynnema TaxID=40566 RepID=UPI0020A283C7|nr:ABC transporter substrate-binding protein [Actinosynnema pretiosum]MCP2094839.1 peptide/nickel transport system substrate-binding protein [Actinosynnema pretiosum]